MQQPFGTVGNKDWQDKPCFILGGGPSLKPYADKLWNLYQKGNILAVNDGHKHCYFPSLIFSLDHTWLKNNLENGWIKDAQAPVICAVDDGNPRTPCENLTYIYRKYRAGINDPAPLSENPGEIFNGMSSGHGALQVAYLKGAKKIFLLGFDYKVQPDAAHFHSGYSWYSKSSEVLFPRWAQVFEDTLPQLKARDVEVYNCSNDSLLKCFSYKPYAEVL